jgi:pimeloyl-ACP methyl ester carboxylesterase
MTSRTVDTARLRVALVEHGPEDGIPVVLVHGNLSTGRFYEHLFEAAPDRYRLIAPDMRGFGDTQPLPIEATHGLRDWADDVHALLLALGIERPPHLAGWSTGGAAVARYAMDRPVASLTLIDPVSPHGYGGSRFPDFAGTGGGTGNPDFTARLDAGDRGTEEPTSPRSVMRAFYWASTHTVEPEHEEMLLDELLKTLTGDDGYPGDSTASEHWPGMAPGTRGILNALSPKYCDWTGLLDVDPRPPVLWTHGTADLVVADGSPFEMGWLGQQGAVPGWPGEEVYPPQPMITEIREFLGRYEGRVETELFEGSGHAPFIDAAGAWSERFFAFLASIE